MKLATYLAQKNITASAFGMQVGVPHKQTMSRYVRGKRFPPPATLKRIRDVTGGAVTADDFVDQHTEEPAA